MSLLLMLYIYALRILHNLNRGLGYDAPRTVKLYVYEYTHTHMTPKTFSLIYRKIFLS